MEKVTLKDLKRIKEKTLKENSQYRTTVLVCGGTGCVTAGSLKIIDLFNEELEKYKLENDVRIVRTGCNGFCALGPTAIVQPEGVFYKLVKEEDIPLIVKEHLLKGKIVEKLVYKESKDVLFTPFEKMKFFKPQTKIVRRDCGLINPTEINEYISQDGYTALGKVLFSMSPDEVIEEIKKSGLRGRGGAGFPTGLKWQFCRRAKGDEKYTLCNADEGDPGAYMDRGQIEDNPYSIIEGMCIAAYAIGSKQGYVYIRAEYPLAVDILGSAIEQAREYGLLGKGILGSDFEFDLELRMGAGAFVCGEETALIASIEGKRGMPRSRPPFPANEGLWGKPTILNNVETYANVPLIILRGCEWFSSIGTENSKGTKVFSLTGDINNSGLVEVPMGTTMGEIVYDVGDGCPKGKKFKAVQSGGPSGGCIPKEHLNVPIDYESLKILSSIMGSGGLVVMDEDTCMVDIARFFLEFVLDESCGKCTPCREGNKRMLDILNRITEGKGRKGDIELLEELCITIKDSALCGLGQTAPNPVLSTIRFFRDEYEAHIKYKKCPAGICQALFKSPCQNACPAGLDTHGYIALIAKSRFKEAYELIMERNPLPATCGRVCTHPCESKCRREEIDEPVAIRSLKRTATDYGMRQDTRAQEHEKVHSPQSMEDRGEKSGKCQSVKVSECQSEDRNQKSEAVAIIGSGPAGLTAAYHLTKMGHKATIFESLPVAGGMLSVGIPEYRLPRKILNKEISHIMELGVEIKLNAPIGERLTINNLLKNGYKAVFIAVGAHQTLKLNISGEDLKGIYPGVEFLRKANLGNKMKLKGKVIVIGGGNVAIDAARVSLRLGADKVQILYRRTRDEMPAEEEEIEEAEREGVEIKYLTIPVEIVGDNEKVKKIICQKMKLAEFDKSGRRRPIPIEKSDFEVDVDIVIPAIGQLTDLSFIQKNDGFNITKRGIFVVDKDTLSTNKEGIFAGGDVAGTATVVDAISHGIKAAISIDKYLGGNGVISEKVRKEAMVDLIPFDLEAEVEEKKRIKSPTLPVDKRVKNFREVEKGYTKEPAIKEANRCLHCDKVLEEG